MGGLKRDKSIEQSRKAKEENDFKQALILSKKKEEELEDEMEKMIAEAIEMSKETTTATTTMGQSDDDEEWEKQLRDVIEFDENCNECQTDLYK